ncbi:hypothetical protein O9992_09875 [Vibrio lentus]|nr:hypothetical protein [Vibrio lentus]
MLLANGDWNSNSMPKPGNIYEASMLVAAFNEMANNLKGTSFQQYNLNLPTCAAPLTKVLRASREGFY